MIIDKVENIGRYAGLGGSFATAAAYLTGRDLFAIPLGTHEIDGKNVYIMSRHNQLNRGEAAFEAHAKYADIQIVLTGSERFISGFDGVQEGSAPGADFTVVRDVTGFETVLTAGQFVLYFPGEPHAPGLFARDDMCRKPVVKVLVN